MIGKTSLGLPTHSLPFISVSLGLTATRHRVNWVVHSSTFPTSRLQLLIPLLARPQRLHLSHHHLDPLLVCLSCFILAYSCVDWVLLDQAQTRPKKTKKKNGGGNTPADNESDTRQRDPKDNPGANRDKWQDVPCDLIPPDIEASRQEPQMHTAGFAAAGEGIRVP
jgi:hypothetical protein